MLSSVADAGTGAERHGDNASMLGGDPGLLGNANGVLELKREYGALGGDAGNPLADDAWLTAWGYPLDEFQPPGAWRKDLVALRIALREASPDGEAAGKRIVLEPGLYALLLPPGAGDGIEIPGDGTALYGSRPDQTELELSAPIILEGRHNVTIGDLRLSGQGIVADDCDRLQFTDLQVVHAAAEAGAALRLRNCSHVSLTRCVVENSEADGIAFLADPAAGRRSARRCFLQDCVVRAGEGSGFRGSGPVQSVFFSGCLAESNGRHGFEITGATAVMAGTEAFAQEIALTDCIAAGHQVGLGACGMYFAGVRNVQVSGGRSFMNKGHGIRVASGLRPSENVRIGGAAEDDTGCLIMNNGGSGVSMHGARSSTVTDCILAGNRVGVDLAPHGVDDDDQPAMLIASCSVLGNEDLGIRVTGGLSAVGIHQNQIRNNGPVSIVEGAGGLAILSASPNEAPIMLIVGNSFADNGPAGDGHLTVTAATERIVAVQNEFVQDGRSACGPSLPHCCNTNFPGDLDPNAAVDLYDYGDWLNCVHGPGVAAPCECSAVDFDCDGDVDWADFADFQRAFGCP